MPHENWFLIAVQDPECDEEDEREQIAIDEGHLVPVMKREADAELLEGCLHS
jgi:hypothetical protein